MLLFLACFRLGLLFMPLDADGEVDLVLGVGVGVVGRADATADAADDATEDAVPAHLQEVGNLAVVAARDVPQ